MRDLNNRICLSLPHMSGLEQQYIAEAFATNWIAPLGPNVDMFEREVADYLDIAGAVALSSGTAAIHLALRLLNIGPGDVVFCSTLTFIASANPILYQGAEPVFIDSEPESWNMSPAALARAFDNADKMGKIPKAVIVVNLYGQSADMEPLSEICRRYNVPIIEDAAESFGATYGDRASGTFGKYGIFSFNGNKIITTSGGGMLVSDDVEGLEKARFLATQARDEAKYYQHSEIGFNYRLSNVLAGIGRGQLKVLPERIKARRAVFDRYHQAFGEIEGVEFMPEAGFGRSTRWLTALTVDPDLCGATSFEILDALAAQNIEARPLWKPLHLQPLFAECGYFPYTAEGSLADKLFARGICLPSGSNMTDEEQFVVIEAVKRCLR